MTVLQKSILVVDENGFSRVCAAILEREGFTSVALAGIEDLRARLEEEDFGLVVTSYPYAAPVLQEIRKTGIPVIVLCDQINREIVGVLEGTDNSCCMIKPLDYPRFRALVRQMMAGEQVTYGGYKVV